MEASSDQLPYFIAAISFALSISALVLYARALSLKKNIDTMTIEMAKKPVPVLVEELENEKLFVSEKLQNGNAVLSKLLEAYAKAEAQVSQIKAGLSPPNFKIDDDENLKSAISEIRGKQHELITSQRATSSMTNWEWFGSKSDGQKLIKTYNKLMISAFNSEFDMVRDKMRHGSYDAAVNKLFASTKALEKLAETVNVMISSEYLSTKEEELKIWYADLERKHEEKEARKEQKAILREQNKTLGRSTDDDEEDEIEDQLATCSAELEKARELAKQFAGNDLAKLELKIEKTEEEKRKLEGKFERATSQAQITRAGYIYVISNIGSFGEGVCKIGMTRRLEPMDRVVELGDASVPYRFDVHTLAFVDDAPRLEKAMHNAFNSKRVNKENHRKEFFFVSPEEVKTVMDNIGIKSSWYYECDAREFRESELMREAMNGERCSHKASIELPEAI
ncbi:MAG: DUF4041 domain-containing protein [Mariprofundaceae bacterium]|nr:DUF4041 domain-containing protein [Mariprofundaceae bacterium]